MGGIKTMPSKIAKVGNTFDAAVVAREYLLRGWQPVPVEVLQKKPRRSAWQSLPITEANVEDFFGLKDNIGIQLGARSAGLTDVDIDCPEALPLADLILPATNAIFGRQSKPGSHRLYVTDLHATEQKAAIQFREPPALRMDGKPATLVELRIGAGEKGAQTLAPGSLHPSGEAVRWDSEGEPSQVAGEELKIAVGRLAAAALLIRHYPADGARHDAALAFGGVLARAKWTADEIKKFVWAVARAASDGEARERGESAAGGVALVAEGKPTPGLPRMREVWGADLTDNVAKWLGLDDSGSKDRGRATKADNQTDFLIALAADAELFHSPEGISYADIIVNGHRETQLINSKNTTVGFAGWLRYRFFEATRGAPNSESLRAALNTLAASARYAGSRHEVYLRVATVADKIYLDLADEDWRVVEIDAQGWRIVDDPPIRFLRRRGMLPLPSPVKPASDGQFDNAIDKLSSYINVATEEDFCLLVTYLAAALRGRGPYPVLVLLGEPGAAKSTLLELLKGLIDPNKAPLRTPPRDARDMFVAASNGYLVAYDNLSDLKDWLSDMFCRLSTGGGFGTRALYTDDDEMLFDAMRPVALTAVDNVVVRGDLADRSLFLTLRSIPDTKRRRKAELWAAFERDRPFILGALLDVVAAGLRQLPNTRLTELPRMADFAEWGEACSRYVWKNGFFLRAYGLNRVGATSAVVEEDLIAGALATFMGERAIWTGETKQLLTELNDAADEATKKHKYWPKAPNALSRRINRLAGMLRKIGIMITAETDSKTKRRGWRIKNEKLGSEARSGDRARMEEE
jgi:hypothetical protein